MANPLERLGAEWIPHPRSPNTTERPTPDPTRPSLSPSPSPTPSDSPAPPETPNTEETSEPPNAPQWGEPIFTESAFALHETGEWATGGATWCETKFFDIDGLTVVGEGAAAADLAWRLCSNTASEPSPDNGMFESCWETDTPHCGAGGFVAVQDGLPAVLWSADRASSLGPEDCLREAESKGSTDHGTGNTEQWNMGGMGSEGGKRRSSGRAGPAGVLPGDLRQPDRDRGVHGDGPDQPERRRRMGLRPGNQSLGPTRRRLNHPPTTTESASPAPNDDRHGQELVSLRRIAEI